jgi:hypothetical protein
MAADKIVSNVFDAHFTTPSWMEGTPELPEKHIFVAKSFKIPDSLSDYFHRTFICMLNYETGEVSPTAFDVDFKRFVTLSLTEEGKIDEASMSNYLFMELNKNQPSAWISPGVLRHVAAHVSDLDQFIDQIGSFKFGKENFKNMISEFCKRVKEEKKQQKTIGEDPRTSC